jgi:hypothetical protein
MFHYIYSIGNYLTSSDINLEKAVNHRDTEAQSEKQGKSPVHISHLFGGCMFYDNLCFASWAIKPPIPANPISRW